MATIIKRATGWQAQTCVKGVRRARTFATRGEAKRWAAETELAAESGVAAEARKTFSEIAAQAFAARRTGNTAKWGLATMQHSELGGKRLCDITQRDIEAYRDECLARMKRQSAARYLADVKTVFSYAVSKHWLDSSPAAKVTIKDSTPLRDRVPTEEEFHALEDAAGWREGEPPVGSRALTLAAFRFAMLTGMRGGEILQIEPAWIDGDVIHLPAEATKTRKARDVALGPSALRLLGDVMALGFRPRIWGISGEAKKNHFIAMRNAAGLGEVRDSEGRLLKAALHFHDSRAAFVTWAAQNGISIQEACRQVGHTTPAMLMRYYRGAAKDLAGKLR